MSWEAFHVQERRWRRDLDAFLVQRIRTPERVQSGRAPRARRTRSTSTSRGDPDPESDPPLLAGFDRLEVLVRRLWAREQRRIGSKRVTA